MGAVLDARLAPMGNHAGLHPKERAAAAISILDLAVAESEEAMDQLLRRDVDSPAWERLHPKAHGAGPQSLKESRPIRDDLERAQEDLQSLRFKLASALFSGMPPGAKQVLDP